MKNLKTYWPAFVLILLVACSREGDSSTEVFSLSIHPKKSMSEETAVILAEEYMRIDEKLQKIGTLEDSGKAAGLLENLVPEAEKLMDKIKEYSDYRLLSEKLAELSVGRQETENQYLEKCMEFASADKKFKSAYEKFVKTFAFH